MLEKLIPFPDLEKITLIISEFLDSIHYSREEDSYFPCVASYDQPQKGDPSIIDRARV